jgi:hypothetical protein
MMMDKKFLSSFSSFSFPPPAALERLVLIVDIFGVVVVKIIV